MQIALALVITLFSATALNLGYLTEASAVKELPPLSAKRPIELFLLSKTDCRPVCGKLSVWIADCRFDCRLTAVAV